MTKMPKSAREPRSRNIFQRQCKTANRCRVHFTCWNSRPGVAVTRCTARLSGVGSSGSGGEAPRAARTHSCQQGGGEGSTENPLLKCGGGGAPCSGICSAFASNDQSRPRVPRAPSPMTGAPGAAGHDSGAVQADHGPGTKGKGSPDRSGPSLGTAHVLCAAAGPCPPGSRKEHAMAAAALANSAGRTGTPPIHNALERTSAPATSWSSRTWKKRKVAARVHVYTKHRIARTRPRKASSHVFHRRVHALRVA